MAETDIDKQAKRGAASGSLDRLVSCLRYAFQAYRRARHDARTWHVGRRVQHVNRGFTGTITLWNHPGSVWVKWDEIEYEDFHGHSMFPTSKRFGERCDTGYLKAANGPGEPPFPATKI